MSQKSVGGPKGRLQNSAFEIESSKSLTTSQRETLRRILLRVYETAVDEAKTEASSTGDYREQQKMRRPQQVFLLDGSRGAGKTTMLFTIRRLVQFMGLNDIKGTARSQIAGPGSFEKFLRGIYDEKWIDEAKAAVNTQVRAAAKSEEETQDLLFPEFRTGDPPTFFCNSHHVSDAKGNVKTRKTAKVLRPLFPTDLEYAQPVMEGVFALMREELSDEIRELEKLSADDERSLNNRKRNAERLELRLYERISTGWHLSRDEGREAILRDSFDYLDFLSRQGSASADSYTRVDQWREFVNDYLDHFDAQLLVVFLDDTDVEPAVTADILHTIRIFLDHPRIVTFLAAHSRSMRHSLIQRSMADLRNAIETLGSTEDSTPREWRHFTRHQIEEYLEKVLPRPNRFFLSSYSTDANRMKAARRTRQLQLPPDSNIIGPQTDFQAITGSTFYDFCCDRLSQDALDYHDARFHSEYGCIVEQAGAQKVIKHIPMSNNGRDDMENFLAWRLFRDRYALQLIPKTIRQIQAMCRFSRQEPSSEFISERLRGEYSKRLAVILFESPANYDLVHRFGDLDRDIPRWLKRQQLSSLWTGERFFEINGRKYHAGTYSYDYLSFRLDLAIAQPVLEDPNWLIPVELLPCPSGRNLKGQNPRYFPSYEQDLPGVARCIDHSTIPANCIYFSDLEKLPDIVWRSETIRDNESSSYPWDSHLSYCYQDLVPRTYRSSRSGLKNVHPIDTEDVLVDQVERYFTDCVVPLAGLELGRFMPTTSEPLNMPPIKEQKPFVLVEHENNFFQNSVCQLEHLRRRIDYFSRLTRVGASQLAVGEQTKDAIEILEKYYLRSLLPVEPNWSSTPGRPEGGTDGPSREPNSDEINSEAELPNPASQAFKERLENENRQLRNTLGDYQWLLNDMRRAWHAGRIFLATVDDYDYPDQILTTEPTDLWEKLEDSTGNRSVGHEIGRRDVYKVPTRLDLQTWFSPKENDCILNDRSMTLFIKRWLSPHEKFELPNLSDESKIVRLEDLAWVVKSKPVDSKRPAKKVAQKRKLGSLLVELESYFGNEWFTQSNQADQTDAYQALVEVFEGNQVAGFVPTMSSDESNIFNQAELDFANRLLMFIRGVGPTLPALIHFEIAGCSYHSGLRADARRIFEDSDSTDQAEVPKVTSSQILQAEQVEKILGAWKKWIIAFSRFTLRYRILCERHLLLEQLRLSKDKGDQRNMLGSKLPLLSPDISYKTLGLQGGLRLRKIIAQLSEKTTKNTNSPGDLEQRLAAIDKSVEGVLKKLQLPSEVERPGGRGSDDGECDLLLEYNKRSIFGDIEQSLLTAMRYILWVEGSFRELDQLAVQKNE